ncbi:MAG TPA: DNA translocase FtsK 4TM domain-containing protein [Chthoniobacterales bacterium]|nr:DNA translocase FtsK 4TM domain-containing protein [Chthoniobacterales bacterium]
MARPLKNSAWNEVFALVLLFLGTLLFLALISYTPKDLPAWIPWSYLSPPNRPAQNFIGWFGAVLASICYFVVGAASYLIAAILLGFGSVKLFHPSLRVRKRVPWIVLFLVSGACLLQLQTRHFLGWKNAFNIPGPGGWIGFFLGKRILLNSTGIVGSVLLVTGVYIATLILMTGLRPIHVVRQTVAGTRRGLRKLHEWRLKRQLRKADAREQLAINQRELAKQRRKIERELKKKGAAVPEPMAPFSSPQELADRPAPKVVDAMALPNEPVAPRRKPTLAELRVMPQRLTITPGLTSRTWEAKGYVPPGLDLLEEHDPEGRGGTDPAELQRVQQTLIDTLAQFGIVVAPGDITRGPTITRYEVYPAKGVRVDKIVSLERDLARATRAERINILAPIPGKDTVGIELANTRKVTVTLREILESADWEEARVRAKIPLALGKDVYGKAIIADLAQMPHLLVAGTTGSGKSVCINGLVASMLFRFTPEELQFIMIDPKVVELQIYADLPHLRYPVITDPKKVLLVLRGLIDEMEKRYKIFARVGVRNIIGFNARPAKKKDEGSASVSLASEQKEQAGGSLHSKDENEIPDKLPYIVVVIDELADLMQTAPADVESAIARITQMARAAGIHLIVATQTPRADVITGVIKANIPSRIAFQVASKIDSRVILDENGADRLLGQGDMLYLPPTASRLIRAQGVLVTDDEIRRIVEFVSAQSPPVFDAAIHEKLEAATTGSDDVTNEDEELVEKCLEIIRQEKRASTSLLQRRLRLGYTRAARIVDILEQRGILGPGEGAKPREILVDLDAAV